MLDKSWVNLCRTDPAYENGATKFVNEVTAGLGGSEMVICPCSVCRNVDRHLGSEVVYHLVTRGMDEDYKTRRDWYHHGEVNSGDAVESKVKQWNDEVLRLYRASEYLDEELASKGSLVDYADGEEEDKEEDEFLAKLADAETPLYPSCEKHSKLSAIVTLYRIKTKNGWSDKSFNDLLESLPAMLPEDNVLHTSMSEQQAKDLRWHFSNKSSDGKDREALVNGLPIGPGAIKIFLDEVMEPETFLWRPTPDLSTIEDSLKSYVAWPVNRVVFFGVNIDTPAGSVSPRQQSTSTPAAPVKKTKDNSQSNSQTPTQKYQQSIPAEVIGKENQKCMLMDITGLKRVVAEGRWSSNDPNMKVHFKPLGPNGVRVWVDVVRVNDAEVWRPSDAVECMEDALGTTVAWPTDKVVLV
ncbi:Transposase-associated domain [Arabidopsis suecica]|uniref:Transposase-associated domain n=1 Tax=Arabidopsis suecica TaxID=45249 RepID=A0A8T1XSE5_ARASU|nr:Transposase-associated domain [Arabidopsis suecica]